MPRKYEVIGDCTDSYVAKQQDDGSYKISIEVPERFAVLVISKLTDLMTDDDELIRYAEFPPQKLKTFHKKAFPPDVDPRVTPTLVSSTDHETPRRDADAEDRDLVPVGVWGRITRSGSEVDPGEHVGWFVKVQPIEGNAYLVLGAHPTDPAQAFDDWVARQEDLAAYFGELGSIDWADGAVPAAYKRGSCKSDTP